MRLAGPNRKRLLWAALIALTLLAYLPVLKAGFIWDDDQYLTANRTLEDPHGLARTWFSLSANPQYYPLVFSGFWLERRVYGLNPLGYHLANVLLHALSACVLWRLLALLGLPGAWLAAAVFALHPLCVESVAWISERKNVLSGLFYFASAYAFLRHATVGGGPPQESARRPGWYALSLILFLAALLSKTVASVLPAALVIVLWWKKGRVSAPDWLKLLPFFALSSLFGCITVWVERHHVGAAGSDWSLGPLERILVAGRGLWFYAAKILWPARLSFVYPRVAPDPADPAAYLFPAAFVLAACLLWLFRKRISRGPLAALGYHFVALFPALGFFNVFPQRYSFVADHFAYHAIPGLVALVVCGIAGRAGRLAGNARPLAPAAAAALLSLLSMASCRHAAVFRGPESLWTRTLAENPAAWMAHNNLGVYLEFSGRTREALAHYRQSLRLRPDLPEVHFNLAVIYGKMGDAERASRHLERALALESTMDEVHYRLGLLLLAKGERNEALIRFMKAARLNPQNTAALCQIASILAGAGDRKRALYYYQKALSVNPALFEAHAGIGGILAGAGDPKEALHHLRLALSLRPADADARNDLGAVLLRTGREREALAEFSEAVRLSPRSPRALTNLALLLARSGRRDEAIARYREAISVEPANPDTLYNLGVLLAQAGRHAEALPLFQKAASLAPDFQEARQALAVESRK